MKTGLLTCALTGEFRNGVTHPPGALAVGLVATILTVLVSIAAPALRNACLIGKAMELLHAALYHHGGQGCDHDNNNNKKQHQPQQQCQRGRHHWSGFERSVALEQLDTSPPAGGGFVVIWPCAATLSKSTRLGRSTCRGCAGQVCRLASVFNPRETRCGNYSGLLKGSGLFKHTTCTAGVASFIPSMLPPFLWCLD